MLTFNLLQPDLASIGKHVGLVSNNANQLELGLSLTMNLSLSAHTAGSMSDAILSHPLSFFELQTKIDFRRFEPLENVIDIEGSRVVVQKQWRDVVQCHHQRCPLPYHVRTAPDQMSWTVMEDGPLSNSASDVALSSSGAGQDGSAAPSAAVKPVSDSSLLQWVYGGEPKPFEALQFPGETQPCLALMLLVVSFVVLKVCKSVFEQLSVQVEADTVTPTSQKCRIL